MADETAGPPDGVGRHTDVLEQPASASVHAFLIADIRGYSTFTREHGDAAAARLATRFAELARDAVAARGGRVVELRGDEALAVFDSAAQAVRAALELQEACREATGNEPALPVGIGVDWGEAVPVEDGFRGAPLNLAARLCSHAAAGQILVTDGVAEEAGSFADVVLDQFGAVELKGFDRPVDVLEVRSTTEAVPVYPAEPSQGPLPVELVDPLPLSNREHELRWLRGTWRQARRGRGRILFVSGPDGIGKTRLAAELAEHVRMSGGTVAYAGSGGAAGADTLAAIADACSAGAPALFVLDELSLYEGAIAALAESVEEIESRPVLALALFRDAEGLPRLGELVDRLDSRGDGHRRLGPLGLADVEEIARSYVGDVDELPAESVLRASAGVPARVHEVVSEWARDEAKRRLAAAAEWLAAGKAKQAAGLDFAHNVIAMKLGRIYSEAETSAAGGSCPYKGLAAFEQGDAAHFYGRERLVGELAARTVAMGLLGVVGPSGSGKSSVVMAGLLPSLAAGVLPGSERWSHAVLRPGEHPAAALESALRTAASGERLVLVVDQFEEIFTTTADELERAVFIDRLVELAHDPERFVVVVTIRADYTGHCAPYPELAELLASNLVLVGPMTPEELRRAIELPARRGGLRVESALGDALVEEVGEEPGGLPLLSTALVELWRAREDGWLRLEAHERTGGVRGAVARLAEASYGQLSPPEREAARTVLLRLVGEGEGESVVRRRVPVSEFDVDRDPTAAAVLSRLTEDRLLTRDDGMIELAHEALVREWPRLRGWLDEDVTGRRLRAHLTQSAKQWADRDRDAGDLYRGARLSATLDWAQTHDRELNELEREFLATSRQAGEREAERQRRTNRRLRGLLIGTAVFLIVALAAGALALVQRSRARSSQSAAEAQALRSDAERLGTLALTEPNFDRSYLLAVAGVQLKDLPETRGDLLTVLQKTPQLFRLIPPTRGATSSLAVSPDGKLLATGDSAGTVQLVDLRTWKPIGETVQLEGSVSQQALAFSPDSQSLAAATATGGDRANLYLVDVSSRTARRVGSWPSVPAAAGPLRFTHMAYSPDGARIAVALATATPASPIPVAERLLLLQAKSGRVVWERRYPLGRALNDAAVAFTPQGRLVTSAHNGETLIWETGTGRIQRRFAFGGPFALSPDGRLAAVARNNPNPAEPSARMAVLDLRTGRHRFLENLPANAWIVDLEFTPDGKSVVGADFAGGLRVWNVASGKIVETFQGGLDLAITPGGRTVLSEGVAWDLSGGQTLGRPFRWRKPEEGCAVTPCFWIDPEGSLMAEVLVDGRVGLVDLQARRLLTRLPATNGRGTAALAFFPDGRTLATGGTDGTVTLWNIRTRSVERKLRFGAPVSWLAVSPDGELVAVQTKAESTPRSKVEVRDIASGDVLYRKAVPNGTGGVEFSPDGRALAALGCCEPDSTIQVWAARSGRQLFSPRIDGHATSIAFAPDGRMLGAGTEDGKVVLWDVRSGTQLGSPIQVAAATVNPISFSPDGRLFAASSGDQTTTLWDVPSRKRLGDAFPVEQASVPVARFAPSGDLVIDNLTDTAQWPMDLGAWKRFACQVAGRELTRAEWRDLLPDRPYRQVCPS